MDKTEQSYLELSGVTGMEANTAEPKKLTNWANEPKLSDLKQDYLDAKPAHDAQDQKISTWLDNLYVRGKAKVQKKPGRSGVQPKLIRKQAEWRYAALSEPFLTTDDIFNTDPVTFEDKQAAIQNGLVLNNQFNTKIPKIRFINEYVRTAVDEGTVICRVGWNFQEEEVEEEVPEWDFEGATDPEYIAQLDQLIELATQDTDTYEEEVPPEMQEAVALSLELNAPVQPVQVGSTIVKKLKVTKNHPTVEVCNSSNVLIDPSCNGDIDKAGFIIYSFETSQSALKKDGKYINLDKIDMDGASILGEPDHESEDDSSFNFKDKPRKKFVAFEYWGYWDIDGTGIVKPVVVTWVGNVVIRMEENPFPDRGLPFITTQYLPVRKSVYGEPDGELLEDNQKIIGAVTRGMIDIMGRSANGQQGHRKDALDVTNKRKFDRGDDYEFNPQVDPRTAFHMHTFPEIPNSAAVMLGIQNQEAESLSGVKAFTGSAGLSGDSLGTSATGVRSALDATAKREMDILRRLSDGIIRIGRKFISMNSEFLSETEVVRITNEEFVEVRRDDLAGDIDLTLSISTAEADDQKASELSFMLQTMGPNSDPGIVKIIQADIARLRKMPTLARKIEEYEPQPDPLAEEEKQLKNELLKAQIQNEYAKAYENQANGNMDNAKVEQIKSETDLLDLQYVEEESGVNQERELEKAGAQARSNMQLKAVEHGLRMREKQNDS